MLRAGRRPWQDDRVGAKIQHSRRKWPATIKGEKALIQPEQDFEVHSKQIKE